MATKGQKRFTLNHRQPLPRLQNGQIISHSDQNGPLCNHANSLHFPRQGGCSNYYLQLQRGWPHLRKCNPKITSLPILRQSHKPVGVANGGTSMARHVSRLPFQRLSDRAARTDTFDNFPSLLMSMGKTSDNVTISIFTKDGVTVHKEQDVLITFKGAGTLTDGYVRSSTLPQVPTKQSASPSGKCLPPYFGIPVLVPTLHRVIGPAIARVQTPW